MDVLANGGVSTVPLDTQCRCSVKDVAYFMKAYEQAFTY